MADYTKLNSSELEALLSHYDIGMVKEAEPLEGGQANTSIKVTAEKGTFVLSICDEKNTDDIKNLTETLVSLERQQFQTTRLAVTKNGENFILHGVIPVYMKEFFPGQIVQNLSTDMLGQVGIAMAALHRLEPIEAIQDYFPYGLEAFETLLKEGINHPYLDWLTKKKTFLHKAINTDMPKGFIHGDIFWDNLLFDSGSLVAILDFEEACYFYKLFDLGMAAVGCCSKNGRFNLSHIRELLNGYTQISPLSREEEAQLNIFIEYAAVSASFWRFRQYNIRRPTPAQKESYKELASLADQIHDLNGALIL